MDENLRIGEVARRTGLTVRTLRYYEETGLLPEADRGPGGHRYYDQETVGRLYRIGLLRSLGTPLDEIGALLDDDRADIADTVERHLVDLDARLAAMGRLRERVRQIGESLRSPRVPSDEQLLRASQDMEQLNTGLRQRITLLVYEDIEAVHDHLVTVFGLGPGRLTRDDDGRVVHGEMHAGDGLIWMHPPKAQSRLASPLQLGAASHCMAVMVEDVDAHHARALAAGADVVNAPRDMAYGVREYDARDIEGGYWSFMGPLPTEGEDDE